MRTNPWEMSPELILVPTGVKGLWGKSSNNLCDAYAVLEVLAKGDKPSMLWRKSPEISAQNVAKSTVKQNTVCPVWDEDFEIELDELALGGAKLCVYMWDRQIKQELTSKRVAGMSGLKQLTKGVARKLTKHEVSFAIGSFLPFLRRKKHSLYKEGAQNWSKQG